MNEIKLETQGACKKFFRKGRESAQFFDAVCPTSLALHAGEVVALKGRSGSGKSTLLNMMAGLLEPSEGCVMLGGTDLYALSDAELSKVRNESIGVIPQGHTALHSLTAVQNVMMPHLMYRGEEGAEARALELLDIVVFLTEGGADAKFDRPVLPKQEPVLTRAVLTAAAGELTHQKK